MTDYRQSEVMMTGRYDTSNIIEDQYEPGSNGKVLRNLLGIVDPVEMGVVETNALWAVQADLMDGVSVDQTFTAQDICNMHEKWLSSIYSWAGKPRSVNISKNGFNFAQSRFVPTLLVEFEREQLSKYTPCRFESRDEVTYALAEVHVELMLIHPFREGNGRLGRILATLMALQAGLPILEFSELDGARREEYYAAVRAGMDRNYRSMKRLFADIIERSLTIS
jgi:cell filamentation protein